MSAARPFATGLRRTLPLMIGAAPFGLVFGALGVGAGLSPAATVGMSLVVFAGSSQFVAAGLVSAGVGIGLIVVTTLVVNIRHLLFSTSLSRSLRALGAPMRALLAFFLTDETYVVVASEFDLTGPAAPEEERAEAVRRGRFQLGSSLGMYLNWQLWTVLGVVAGSRLVGMTELGLEIAMGVSFVGMVVPMIVSVAFGAAAVTAGAVALALADAAPNSGILIATLAGVGVGFALESVATGRGGADG